VGRGFINIYPDRERPASRLPPNVVSDYSTTQELAKLMVPGAGAKAQVDAPRSSARSELLQGAAVMDPQPQELGSFHIPVVSMSVKTPVASSML
jgi:hypothetical protein